MIVLTARTSTPLQPIKGFGSASRTVGSTARDAYRQFDSEIATAKYKTAMIRRKPVSPDTFNGVLSKNKRLARREAMLDELVNYATGLEALATKDTSADIKDAATKLDTNLNGLGEDYGALRGGGWPLTKADSASLATITKVIGDAWVLNLREDAIRKVVIKADHGIQKASTLLQHEFEGMGPTVGGIYAQTEVAFADAYNKENQAMNPADRSAYADEMKKIQDPSNRSSYFLQEDC